MTTGIAGRVCVTGASGQAGRAVVRELLEDGYDVAAATREDLEAGMLRADLTDYGEALQTIEGTETVVHLANIPAPGLSTPAVTFNANVAMNLNVFWRRLLCGEPNVAGGHRRQPLLRWIGLGRLRRQRLPERLQGARSDGCKELISVDEVPVWGGDGYPETAAQLRDREAPHSPFGDQLDGAFDQCRLYTTLRDPSFAAAYSGSCSASSLDKKKRRPELREAYLRSRKPPAPPRRTARLAPRSARRRSHRGRRA